MASISYVPSIHQPNLHATSMGKSYFNEGVNTQCTDAQELSRKILSPSSTYNPDTHYRRCSYYDSCCHVPSFIVLDSGRSYRSERHSSEYDREMSVGGRIATFALAGLVTAFVVNFISQFSTEVRAYQKSERLYIEERNALIPSTAPHDHPHIKPIRELADMKLELIRSMKNEAIFYRAIAVTVAVAGVLIMIGALFGEPLPIIAGLAIGGISLLALAVKAIYNAWAQPKEILAEKIQEKAQEILKIKKQPTDKIESTGTA